MAEILKLNTYSEAKEKYQKRKDEQEIKVGDEVEDEYTQERFIISKICSDAPGIYAIFENGNVYYLPKCRIERLKKTGRHFDLTPMFEFLREGGE